jgi:hypothetical protein
MKRPLLLLSIIAVIGIVLYFMFCNSGGARRVRTKWDVSPPSDGKLGPRNEYNGVDDGIDHAQASDNGMVYFGSLLDLSGKGVNNSRATTTVLCQSDGGNECKMILRVTGESRGAYENLTLTAQQIPPIPQTTQTFVFRGGPGREYTVKFPCGTNVEIIGQVHDSSEDPKDDGIQTHFGLMIVKYDCK